MHDDEWYQVIDFLTESDFPSFLCVCSEWNKLLNFCMQKSWFWMDRHIRFLNTRIKLYSGLIAVDSSHYSGMRRFLKMRIDHHLRKLKELREERKVNYINFKGQHFIAVKKYEDSNNCKQMIDYLKYRPTAEKLSLECFLKRDTSKLVSYKFGEIFQYMFENYMNSYHYRKVTMDEMTNCIIPDLILQREVSSLQFWDALLNNHPKLRFDSGAPFLDFFTCILNAKSNSDNLDELVMKFLKSNEYNGLDILSVPIQLRFARRVAKILKENNVSFIHSRVGYSSRRFRDISITNPVLSEYLEYLSSNRVMLSDFLHEEFIFVGGVYKYYLFADYKVDICGKSSNGVNWIINLVDNFPTVDVIDFFTSISFKGMRLDWTKIDPSKNILDRLILGAKDPSERLSIIKGFHNKNVDFSDLLLAKIIDSSAYGNDKKSSIIRETVEYLLPIITFENSNEQFKQYYDMNVNKVKGNNWSGTDFRLELCFKVWKIIG